MANNSTSNFENTSVETQILDLYDYDYFGFGNPDIYDPILNIFLCVSSGFGTAANIFVLIIILRTKFGKRLSLQFLAHQAVCDLESSVAMLACTVAIWSKSSGPFICYMLWSQALLFTGLYAAVFNTVCLATERYMMVAFPLKYRVYVTKARAKIAMATSWLVSIVLNTPVVTAIYIENGQCYMDYFLSSVRAQTIYSYILVATTFIIPIIFICIAYGHMMYIIHNKKLMQVQTGLSSVQSTNNSTKMSKAEMNIFQTLLIVTVVFMVTWIPNQLYYLLWSIGLPLDFLDPLYNLSMILVQINACVNPFIYIYKFKEFRVHALAILKCQSSNQVIPESTLTSSQPHHPTPVKRTTSMTSSVLPVVE